VDVQRFHPESRAEARRKFGLGEETRVLVSIGGLCERKGFHRVIDVLPRLREQFPDLCFLIVGGASPEGDWSERLRTQVRDMGLDAHVRFLGPQQPDELRWPLSAADVFVLATSNEGWANVFLEAMACGLPIVTTDVGGNREVVTGEGNGILVPFGNGRALCEALGAALEKEWDRSAIRARALENTWEQRVETLVAEFRVLAGECVTAPDPGSRALREAHAGMHETSDSDGTASLPEREDSQSAEAPTRNQAVASVHRIAGQIRKPTLEQFNQDAGGV
jgi:glycosyltransferase involved in cell wall biosynthesis